MKSTPFMSCRPIILATILAGAALAASASQPLELTIQMIPGIWINGSTGAVNIEYTTNLDQTTGWTLLATVLATSSPHFYIDATATNAPKRFYRAAAENASPANPDPQHLVWIKPGIFTMGGPLNEDYRQSDEGPLTQVTISQGFWMSRHETVQEDYSAVMGINPSQFKGEAGLPVETVSWNDATNYCAKLTKIENAAGRLPAGFVYRLPTEAEWEYACRAGTTTASAFGNSFSSTQANFDGFNNPYGGAARGPSLGAITKAGSYAPNAWGLYDMHGNVGEWCLDWHGTYPGGSQINYRGPSSGLNRVNRGGSFSNIGGSCRSASRYGNLPSDKGSIWGFRPVLAQE